MAAWTWAELGKKLSEKVITAIFGQFWDVISGNELQEALEDAIEKININTKRAIDDSRKRELEANVEAAFRQLSEYRNVKTDMSLEFISRDVNRLVSQLKTLDLFDPDGPGLLGHPIFMVAANLKMAIHQEREKKFWNAELKNESNFLLEAINHAYDMHAGWVFWNRARFTPVQLTPLSYEWSYFRYKLDKKWVIPGCIGNFDLPAVVDPDPPFRPVITWEEAIDKWNKHRSDEFLKLYKEFVEPSAIIVGNWKKRLKNIEHVTVNFSKLIRPKIHGYILPQ